MRFLRDNTENLTTTYTVVEPDFVISEWGLHIISGSVIVEVYDDTSWVRQQTGNSGDVLTDNYDCTKIRFKASTGTAVISYSLEGRKEFSASAGDMKKSVYDTDDDGIVDKAESLDDGEGNSKTAEEVKDHIEDLNNPHGVDKIDVGLSNVPNLDTTDAVANEHTHSNKGTLDAIEEAFTTDLKNKLDGVEENSVSLATVKADADIASAISLKHSQNTDTQLDSGVVAVDGSDNVSINQNSVAVFQSVAASAVVNTLVLKEGKVGIGTDNPDGRLNIVNALSDKHGVYIKIDVALASGKRGLFALSDVEQTDGDAQLAMFQLTHANSLSDVVRISGGGRGRCLNILVGGVLDSGRYAFDLSSSAIQNNDSLLARIVQDHVSSTAGVVEIYNDGSGTNLLLTQNGVLAANRYALYIYSNAIQINSYLVNIRNNNSSSTANMARFDNVGTGTVVEIVSAGVIKSGTLTAACLIYSNAPQVNNPLLYVMQDSSLATADNTLLEADGIGNLLHLKQNGNLASGKYILYLDNNGTPVDGSGRCIRFDGCTVSSTKDPTTDAPDGFLGMTIDGGQKAVPYYALS